MLIHPWDASLNDGEWRNWLADGHDFGQLVAVGEAWPVIVPTHFVVDGDAVLIHLARPNPIWRALEGTGSAVLSVADDYAFIPSYWRVDPSSVDATHHPGGEPVPEPVPTSYYAALQLRCRAEIIDDPAEKAALLSRQLQHFQPEGGYTSPEVDGAHGRLLAGIRGLRLEIVDVLAKFKYDNHKPAGLQIAVNEQLRTRGSTGDVAASAQQERRRLAEPTGLA